ncbi:hypothetical protein [Crenobacter luteus]|uniref:Lipoprotein n=1 Tax=Crenobacter luteus TaxID=1452487 RepID=A0A161SCI4_9NEIS|nr:hypothetical protein [Crenobacter luteus]KZE33853.1 hypothetical protein AVW16_07240 [Crenobacter luteus]
MKRQIGLALAAIALGGSLAGCVVVPRHHYHERRTVVVAPERYPHGDRYDRRPDRRDRDYRYERRGRW